MMWSWKRDIGPWTTLRALVHCDANEESCCGPSGGGILLLLASWVLAVGLPR